VNAAGQRSPPAAMRSPRRGDRKPGATPAQSARSRAASRFLSPDTHTTIGGLGRARFPSGQTKSTSRPLARPRQRAARTEQQTAQHGPTGTLSPLTGVLFTSPDSASDTSSTASSARGSERVAARRQPVVAALPPTPTRTPSVHGRRYRLLATPADRSEGAAISLFVPLTDLDHGVLIPRRRNSSVPVVLLPLARSFPTRSLTSGSPPLLFVEHASSAPTHLAPR